MGERIEGYEPNVPVKTPPRRVVSLAPWLTLSLFELGLGDRLVAVTAACTGPEAALARLLRVGAPGALDTARIAALRPDIVMASADDNRPDDIRALEAAGLEVWLADPRTVRDAINHLWDIMDAFDKAAMVPRVRLIDQTLDHVESAAASREARAVYASVGPGAWRAFNRNTYAHDLLRVCGGRNVFADREARYFSVTPGEVAAAQPGIVLLPDDCAPDEEAALRALDIPAALTGQIHRLESNLLAWPGTQTARALSAIPALLMPGERDSPAGQAVGKG